MKHIAAPGYNVHALALRLGFNCIKQCAREHGFTKASAMLRIVNSIAKRAAMGRFGRK